MKQAASRKEAKEVTHERIVDAAARAIRRSGYGGTGVADIMKDAGLTHGGFYAHFASREAMLAEAMDRAGAETVAASARVAAAPCAYSAGFDQFVLSTRDSTAENDASQIAGSRASIRLPTRTPHRSDASGQRRSSASATASRSWPSSSPSASRSGAPSPMWARCSPTSDPTSCT